MIASNALERVTRAVARAIRCALPELLELRMPSAGDAVRDPVASWHQAAPVTPALLAARLVARQQQLTFIARIHADDARTATAPPPRRVVFLYPAGAAPSAYLPGVPDPVGELHEAAADLVALCAAEALQLRTARAGGAWSTPGLSDAAAADAAWHGGEPLTMDALPEEGDAVVVRYALPPNPSARRCRICAW